MTVKAPAAMKCVDEKRSFFVRISDEIWEYAEVGLHEDRSAKCLEDALESEGFNADEPGSRVSA